MGLSMKKKIRSLLLICLLPLAAFLLSGCVAVAVGGAAAVGTSYALGDLTVPILASPEELQEAIKRGGRDEGLQYIKGSGDETSGEYIFRNAEDRKVTVSYQPKSPVYLEMSIRVGTFGDEPISISLKEAIEKHL